jgi:hypothetical protein
MCVAAGDALACVYLLIKLLISGVSALFEPPLNGIWDAAMPDFRGRAGLRRLILGEELAGGGRAIVSPCSTGRADEGAKLSMNGLIFRCLSTGTDRHCRANRWPKIRF